MGEITIAYSGSLVLPDALDVSIKEGGKASISLVPNPSLAEIQAWEEKWTEYGRGRVHRWRWNSKLKSLPGNRQGLFLALAEGANCHGMMIVSWPFPSRAGKGDVLYIDYLEVGPHNRSGTGEKQQLDGVGTTLLDLAAGPLSKALALTGIGLHSLKSAEGFYNSYGMKEFAKENGLTYFESPRRGQGG